MSNYNNIEHFGGILGKGEQEQKRKRKKKINNL